MLKKNHLNVILVSIFVVSMTVFFISFLSRNSKRSVTIKLEDNRLMFDSGPASSANQDTVKKEETKKSFRDRKKEETPNKVETKKQSVNYSEIISFSKEIITLIISFLSLIYFIKSNKKRKR